MALVSVTAASAFASDKQVLWAEPVGKVKIDGVPREWKGQMTPLSVRVSGNAKDEPKAEAIVGYDEEDLYVALDVTDDKLVRTGGAGGSEDHATLHLAFPVSGGGQKVHRIDLYPGVPGKSPALVKIDGQKLKGAKIVEAPTDEGFTLEATFPWSTFASARKVRTGLRGTFTYTDSDRAGAVKAVIATAKATSGNAMPAMMLEAEQGLYSSLLRPNDLGAKPARSVTGDVCGDEMLEQVAIYGHYLTIVGGHYREGREFYYSDLVTSDASMVTRLALEDFDGDGKSEILTIRRIGTKKEYREVLQVVKLNDAGEPSIAFTHEVGIGFEGGVVVNDVKTERSGGRARILIEQSKKSDVDEETYKEPVPGDMPSALLPWDEVTSRTFEWRGSGFEETSQKKQKVSSKRARRASSAPAISVAPRPRPPNPDELMDQVYALYRKDRGVSRHAPSFDFVTNMDGDETPERVLVHDKDIVLFGKEFLGGTSYSYITMGVQDAKDVVDVTAKDLTGDGLAEIIARLDMRATASEELGGEEVIRHAVVIYNVKGSRLMRIFAAEVSRSLGSARMLGGMAFIPSSSGGVDIELRPGRGIGWTKATYPFPEDMGPSGGLEALVLPWHGKARRYRYEGNFYVE